MSVSTLDATGSALATESRDQELSAERECEAVRRDFRRKLTGAVADATSLFTEKEMKMWEDAVTDGALEAAGFKTAAAKAKAIKENFPWLEKNLNEARTWGSRFFSAINEAVSSGALTAQNAEHAKALTYKRRGDWTQVKKFFTEDGVDSFQRWKRNWKDMAGLVKNIDTLQKKMKLADSGNPELQKFRAAKGEKFEVRMQLAEKAVRSLTDLEGENKLAMNEAKTILRSAVSAKALAPNKMDGWIAHIFTKYKGEKARQFIEKTLPAFVEDWKEVADDFRHFRKKALEKGKDIISEETFLAMSYDDRKRKLLEIRSSLSGMSVDDEKLKNVEHLKMRIKFNLQTEDVETADELISRLEYEHPDDQECGSLRSQVERMKLRMPKKEAAEKPSLHDLETTIWKELGRIPNRTHAKLIRTAAKTQNIRALERVMQMIYNEHWCVTHGYLNDNIAQKEAKNERNKDKTREYSENGHSKGREANIIEGDTAHFTAIRRERINRPQLLFVSEETEACNAIVRSAVEHEHDKNVGLGYWGTIKTMDEHRTVKPYADTKYFVESIYYPLKTAFKQFFGRGGTYRNPGEASAYEKAQVAHKN